MPDFTTSTVLVELQVQADDAQVRRESERVAAIVERAIKAATPQLNFAQAQQGGIAFGRVFDDIRTKAQAALGGIGGSVRVVGSVLQTLGPIAARVGAAIGDGIKAGVRFAINAAEELARSVKAVFTVAGTAVAGFLVTTVATGVQFNILQSRTRAAFSTILGGTKAADAALKDVNKLVDESPFSRGDFLQASQQLLSFGFAAKDLVPTLDAIQQAVAATAGSSADISALAGVFAQIKTAGRATTQDLLQLSTRGINAFEILAKAAGKSVAMIREDISNGAVDAEFAITALTKGLKEQFAGATEGVRGTILGAIDRLKAATRDIGSVLATPFVDPKGGGAAVTIINNIASAFRVIQKDILPQILPLIDRFALSLVPISDRILAFVKAISGEQVNSFLEKLKAFAPVLAGLAAILTVTVGQSIPVLGQLLGGLNPIVAALGAFAFAIPEVRDAFAELFNTLKPVIGELLNALTPVLVSLGQALTPIIQALVPAIGNIVKALVPLIEEILPPLSSLLGTVSNLIASLIPPIEKVAVALLTALTPILPGLIDALDRLLQALVPIIEAIGDGLADVIIKILPSLPGLVDSFVALADATTEVLIAVTPLLPIFIDISTFMLGPFIGSINRVTFVIKVLSRVVEFLFSKINSVLEFFGVKTKKVADEANKNLGSISDTATKTKTFLDKVLNIPPPRIDTSGVEKELFDLAGANKRLSAAQAEAAKTAESQKSALLGVAESASKAVAGLLGAAGSVSSANQAVAGARSSLAEATTRLGEIEASRAKIIQDTISPLKEIEQTERSLIGIRSQLRDIDQQKLDVERQLQELRDPATLAEKLARADINVLRAKIAVNKALREEKGLTEEVNETSTASINLAGLSVDQIRTKLANVRETLKLQRETVAIEAKTPEELEDESLTKRLNVLDTEQALKEATEIRQNLEIDNNETIIGLEDKLVALDGQRVGLSDQLIAGQNTLNGLRAGETTLAAALKKLDEEIAAAKEREKIAQDQVTTAVQAQKVAQIELGIEQAKLTGDVLKQTQLTGDLLRLKGQIVGLSEMDKALLEKQIGLLDTQIGKFKEIQGLKQKIFADDNTAIAFGGDFGNILNPSFTATSAGAVPGGTGAANAAIEALTKAIFQTADFQKLTASLRRDTGNILKGFALGGVIENDTVARLGEGGRREVVLPLTRPARLQELLAHSRVLPPVLAALGKVIFPSQGRIENVGFGFGLHPPEKSPLPLLASLGSGGSRRQNAGIQEQRNDPILRVLQAIETKLNNLGGDTTNNVQLSVSAPNPERAAWLAKKAIERQLRRI